MTGLSKITDKILDAARAEAAQKLAEADAECARISAEYKEKADKITLEATADAKNEATEIVMRARSGEVALRKNLIFKMQGEMIDKAFEIAENELVSLSGNARLDFLVDLLSSALTSEWEAEQSRAEIYGDDEENDGERIYEVMLNAKDRANFGGALMDNFKRRIVGKDMGDLPSRVVLSEDCANIEGGLIIRIGKVEINNSVKSIVAGLRSRLEPQVARILFPEA
jgi:V/A-type H+-transporting ATPase subunit E